MDSEGGLVKPEAAKRQLEEEERERVRITEDPSPSPGGDDGKIVGPGGKEGGSGETTGGGVGPVPDPTPVIDTPSAKKLHRFYGTIEVEPLKLASKSQEILKEVVQHLAGQVGAQVTISIDISAHFPDGISEDVVRTVTENCRTLKFRSSGFEEE